MRSLMQMTVYIKLVDCSLLWLPACEQCMNAAHGPVVLLRCTVTLGIIKCYMKIWKMI